MSATHSVLARTLVLLAATFGLPSVTLAQVGIQSGLTQVALVAHVAPRGSIQGVSAARETGLVGGLRESSATVRVSANTGYRLKVKAAGSLSSRVWVRAATGEFQELTAGSPVIVARGAHTAGESDRVVEYRTESTGIETLPVRYEIALSPAL